MNSMRYAVCAYFWARSPAHMQVKLHTGLGLLGQQGMSKLGINAHRQCIEVDNRYLRQSSSSISTPIVRGS